MIPLANVFQPLIDAAEVVILFLHDDLRFGWGASIVGLTFLVRILILPLSVKQISSMRHLQAHAPEMKALQERYKDDKERLQREMMKFYRENKVNPLASCWPILLQLPVFLSLFYLLRGDDFKADVLGSPPEGWLFIADLTEPATGGELIALIALFIGTQIGATLVMTSRVNRQQQMLMMLLPLIIVPFIASFPAGLALYWITTNVWTLGQQWVVYTFWPPPEPASKEEAAEAVKAPPPPPPRKKKRRR